MTLFMGMWVDGVLPASLAVTAGIDSSIPHDPLHPWTRWRWRENEWTDSWYLVASVIQILLDRVFFFHYHEVAAIIIQASTGSPPGQLGFRQFAEFAWTALLRTLQHQWWTWLSSTSAIHELLIFFERMAKQNYFLPYFQGWIHADSPHPVSAQRQH